MNKLSIALIASLAFAPAALAAGSSESVRAPVEAGASVSVKAGKMIYGANGGRIAPAYRVGADGSVQVILDGKLVRIPASTLSQANGKIVTTLTKAALSRSR